MSRVKWPFFVLIFSAKLMAASLQVPDPYLTIQSAIDAAVSSDEVIVQPGTYYENINFAGKSITVRSADPDDSNVVVRFRPILIPGQS